MRTKVTMTALVRSELKKISSTRLWWGLLLGAMLWTGLNAGITAGFAGIEPGAGQPATPGLDTPEAIRSVYAAAAFGGAYVFALILGITGMTQEYRYQTITPTFLVCPRRSRVVGAKIVAHLAVGVLYGAAALVAAVAVGALVIGLRGYDLGFGAERLWSSMVLAVVAVALWTLIGIGIGTFIRNQVVAILVGILVTFLLEPLITVALNALELEAVGKFLPSNASSALMAPSNSFVDYLDWWAGGLVLLGYAAVLAGLGMLANIRRDVT
jgi:ABC-type transport system involved in multi-copper enzyme maturation permease subunit